LFRHDKHLDGQDARLALTSQDEFLRSR